jgi:hypothetical protein
MSQSIESVKYFYEYYIQRLFRKFVAKARRHGIIFDLVECLGLGSEDKLVSTGLLFDDEEGRENEKKEGMEKEDMEEQNDERGKEKKDNDSKVKDEVFDFEKEFPFSNFFRKYPHYCYYRVAWLLQHMSLEKEIHQHELDPAKGIEKEAEVGMEKVDIDGESSSDVKSSPDVQNPTSVKDNQSKFKLFIPPSFYSSLPIDASSLPSVAPPLSPLPKEVLANVEIVKILMHIVRILFTSLINILPLEILATGGSNRYVVFKWRTLFFLFLALMPNSEDGLCYHMHHA